MTKSEAIDLMRQYAAFTDEFAADRSDGRRHSYNLLISLGHIRSMPDRFPEEGSVKKAMRWLGFMQGALWMVRAFTLEELKDHSRRKSL
jgi:hypothetical protein